MSTLMAESEGELNSLLMKVKEESEKFGLKLNIQKNKIMFSRSVVSDSATPWTAARQASLSITNSRSLLKLTSPAVTTCNDFGAPKNKVCHCFPIYFP